MVTIRNPLLIFTTLFSLLLINSCDAITNVSPTNEPTEQPTEVLTEQPTEAPTEQPTEVPTEQPTEVPTEQPTEAPTEQPTAESTSTVYEVMTKLPNGDLQFHYNFHGDVNKDGSLDGLSVEDFDRYFYLDGCRLNTTLTDDYLLIYHEGGQNVTNYIDDCQIRFVKEVSDSFFEKELKLIRIQYSLSYGTVDTGKDERNINYHFYPTSSTVNNSEYHESQFVLRFTCQANWDNSNRYDVVYSNGLKSFYKTIGSDNPIDRFHTIEYPNENWNRLNTELNIDNILDDLDLVTHVYVLNYEPQLDSKTVKLYVLPEVLPEISHFSESRYRWEVDREVNGKGGFNCIYPRSESFGVKLVGDGGIELRIYDIFIITKPRA
jgi:hypothetical protein